ncbi:protein kinase [Sodiomyces alkalinus F11]|uniref:EKC/KEOPS complex subunit BUD32 n=1 Tax=Sodiomyces alkalinus (strain CBS 110278 / VKM F-3762 / F11) TaxID=1314773 RepID=A0A3N2Q1F9_SODAK|nr:protein kinase [Sodiomyces alkalinus F11]ROT40445.1 protein kinase [Sodiomyces alkalinus F11]
MAHQSSARAFRELPVSDIVEEEGVPGYRADDFYPVSLGEVLADRYRIVAKLGFGVGSTVWLCRDLLAADTRALKTIKVCTAQRTSKMIAQADAEIAVATYLQSVEGEHPGRNYIRLLDTHFAVQSPHGTTHQCLVYQPLGMTLTELRDLFSDRALEKSLFKNTLQIVLCGLDFLHQAGVVHTDISPNNLLLGVKDASTLLELEQAEQNTPIPRKVLPDRSIYISRPMPITHGMPVICDFGTARMGEKHSGDIMPELYRAPEVILGMEWDCKVDLWAVGVMLWDLFEKSTLFGARVNGVLSDEVHLAEMVSLLGPPPPDFISRSEACKKYFDSEGNWVAATPVPGQSLFEREVQLQGEEKDAFVRFARRMLCWRPEERPTAVELMEDDFFKFRCK